MNIEEKSGGENWTLALTGRFDALAALELEKTLRGKSGLKSLTLDFSGVPYIASAGIRVILLARKLTGSAGGAFKIRNAAPSVREVFEITKLIHLIDLE